MSGKLTILNRVRQHKSSLHHHHGIRHKIHPILQLFVLSRVSDFSTCCDFFLGQFNISISRSICSIGNDWGSSLGRNYMQDCCGIKLESCQNFCTSNVLWIMCFTLICYLYGLGIIHLKTDVSDVSSCDCVIPENIHSPPTDGSSV